MRAKNLESLYRKNKSLFTLLSGASAGLASALLVLALITPVLQEALSLSFALMTLNWGLFLGAFVGGIVGIFAHRSDWTFLRTVATLGAFFALFLLLLGIAVILQLNPVD